MAYNYPNYDLYNTPEPLCEAALLLREPHHIRHKLVRQKKDNSKRDLLLDLTSLPLLQGGGKRLESESIN